MNTNTNQESGEKPRGGTTPPGQYPPPPYPGTFPVPPPRRRLSGFTIFLLILCGFLLLLVISLAASKTADIAFGGDFGGKYQEKMIKSGAGKEPGKLAIIDVTGAIMGNGSHVTGEGMVNEVSKQLRLAAKDPAVKAILLQVDSPGGGLSASDILRDEVMRLQKAGKKVIVYVGSLAASGGLYISSPVDYIIANPTALVGSIGVIMTRFQMDGLLQKLGIKYDPIKSTKMKDIGSPFRDLNAEERKYFEDLIQTFNERFIGIVAEGRKIDIDEVRKLANGKIYTAEQALEYKLIDAIGYYDDALAKTKELGELEDPHIVKYSKRFDELPFLNFLLDSKASTGVNELRIVLESIIYEDAVPRIMAIWNGRMD